MTGRLCAGKNNVKETDSFRINVAVNRSLPSHYLLVLRATRPRQAARHRVSIEVVWRDAIPLQSDQAPFALSPDWPGHKCWSCPDVRVPANSESQ
jgi:hypothetical protein